MKPVRCATCQLKWNIREDAPRVITCPGCLAALNNPYPPEIPASPLPVIPVEQQVNRDRRAGNVGFIVVIVIVFFGLLSMMSVAVRGASTGAFLLIALVVIVAASVSVILFGWKPGRPAAPMPTAVIPAGDFMRDSRTLNYQSPMPDARKLSGGAFFGQVIGGIIAGIVGTVVLIAILAQIGSGEAGILGLLLPIAGGIALCFKPMVRGLGVGLIIALPVGFLLLLGFCAILIGSGGLNFH